MDKNVLVVDDEVDFASFVKDVSLDMGDVAETCHSSKQAREIIDRFTPDVIVLDIIMPGEDGIEFLLWLAEQTHQPRVILVTGFDLIYAETANKLAKGIGVDVGAVIPKPVPVSTLRAALS